MPIRVISTDHGINFVAWDLIWPDELELHIVQQDATTQIVVLFTKDITFWKDVKHVHYIISHKSTEFPQELQDTVNTIRIAISEAIQKETQIAEVLSSYPLITDLVPSIITQIQSLADKIQRYKNMNKRLFPQLDSYASQATRNHDQLEVIENKIKTKTMNMRNITYNIASTQKHKDIWEEEKILHMFNEKYQLLVGEIATLQSQIDTLRSQFSQLSKALDVYNEECDILLNSPSELSDTDKKKNKKWLEKKHSIIYTKHQWLPANYAISLRESISNKKEQIQKLQTDIVNLTSQQKKIEEDLILSYPPAFEKFEHAYSIEELIKKQQWLYDDAKKKHEELSAQDTSRKQTIQAFRDIYKEQSILRKYENPESMIDSISNLIWGLSPTWRETEPRKSLYKDIHYILEKYNRGDKKNTVGSIKSRAIHNPNLEDDWDLETLASLFGQLSDWVVMQSDDLEKAHPNIASAFKVIRDNQQRVYEISKQYNALPKKSKEDADAKELNEQKKQVENTIADTNKLINTNYMKQYTQTAIDALGKKETAGKELNKLRQNLIRTQQSITNMLAKPIQVVSYDIAALEAEKEKLTKEIWLLMTEQSHQENIVSNDSTLRYNGIVELQQSLHTFFELYDLAIKNIYEYAANGKKSDKYKTLNLWSTHRDLKNQCLVLLDTHKKAVPALENFVKAKWTYKDTKSFSSTLQKLKQCDMEMIKKLVYHNIFPTSAEDSL